MSAARLFHSAALVVLAACASRCSLLYGFDYTQAPPAVDAAPAGDAPDDATEVDPPCPAGLLRCESEACIDVQSNGSHCGQCNNACAIAGATAACIMGRCTVASCDAELADCDGDLANGCETRVTTATEHCGRCGARCAPERAVGACVDAVCRILSCEPGYADCDGSAANGCEVDTRASADHCGGCGQRCGETGAAGLCAGGACVCGRSGQACCASGAPCVEGVCVAGTCRADCGNNLQGCCDGRCGQWNNCIIAACVACGGRAQPCCAQGGACMGALNCRLGVCVVL